MAKVWILALVSFLLTGTVHAQDAIDLTGAVVERSASDVASWPITTTITRLELGAGDCAVEFSTKDTWPNVPIPGWNGGSIAYTLWLVRIVNGQVYTGGGIEFWRGRVGGCGPAAQYIANWFYDASWGPLNTAGELTPGERVGFFVTAGDARAKDVRTVTARSAVVAVPWPGGAGGSFIFGEPPIVNTPPPIVNTPPPVLVPPVVAAPPAAAGDLLEQVRALVALETDTNQKVTEIHAEVRTIAQQFGSVMAFAGKYIAPALAAWYGGKAMTK